ncbi:hypothetical protein PGT21_035475 [Puccinia graminis f. sp. tritici]|uniref:Uncharacterized protein n=1 Tax=Puccinia graminis f. sp. tritici TaxID=56615 RepID=A0A5B0QQ98_PUCGR|nr:hypothetical protein PGT21_035475 [Puccinia graminis f. sp. tritici]
MVKQPSTLKTLNLCLMSKLLDLFGPPSSGPSAVGSLKTDVGVPKGLHSSCCRKNLDPCYQRPKLYFIEPSTAQYGSFGDEYNWIRSISEILSLRAPFAATAPVV